MDEYIKNDALAYIIKYIEKTGERIVYSKGLPQFFISDIMDDDIVCPIGLEDKKLLLFDNFVCWDEGEYIGEVSADVIKRMRNSHACYFPQSQPKLNANKKRAVYACHS